MLRISLECKVKSESISVTNQHKVGLGSDGQLCTLSLWEESRSECLILRPMGRNLPNQEAQKALRGPLYLYSDTPCLTRQLPGTGHDRLITLCEILQDLHDHE